ncbi:hypothetical protein [Pseudomonas sp. EA_35y_Pfl2_R111]|uniref:hypothetical protein n=1 Tax=Pseudomonas sp. EA_35y_Pfl2_R111 TaxID=3088689 RepID=UPI0030D9FB76
MDNSFSSYKALIRKAIQDATFQQHSALISGVLLRFSRLLEASDVASLSSEQLELHKQLISMVQTNAMDLQNLRRFLHLATEISDSYEDHAIYIDPNVIQFWSALDSFSAYEADASPDQVASISESILNVLDYHYTGSTPLEQWLTTPEIRQELGLQLQDLGTRL